MYEVHPVIVLQNEMFITCDMLEEKNGKKCDFCCRGTPAFCEEQELYCQTEPNSDFAILRTVMFVIGGFIIGIHYVILLI